MWVRFVLAGLTILFGGGLGWLAQHRSPDPAVLGRYSSAYAALLLGLAAAALCTLAAQAPRIYWRVYARRFQLGLLGATLLAVPVGLELLVRRQDPLGISYYEEIRRYGLDKVADEELVYRHPPSLATVYQDVPVFFNELGLRDRPIVPKAPGQLRILLLGDSVTFGWGVPVEETFGRRLEASLAARLPGGARVVNAGVGSYNTVQELAFLERHGDSLDPDRVLLLYVNNDVERERRPFDPWAAESLSGKRPLETVLLLLDRSWLYRLSRHALRYAGAVPPPAAERDSAGWRASLEALAGVESWCDRHGVPLVVFFWRGRSSPDWEDALFRDIAEAGDSGDFPVIDVAPWWSGMEWSEMVNSRVDSHPSARGHRILAEGMERRLDELGLLPTSAPR